MSPVSELLNVPNHVDRPTLSPAEYSQALTHLYGHRSVRSLCDAAAQLGTAAPGPALVALWQRRGASDHLLLAATVSLGQTAWQAVARELALPRAYAVFREHRGQPVGGLSVSSILATLTDSHEAIAPSTAERTLASVAFVERDGLLAGVTLVAIQSQVPLAALHALSGHTAAAMRQLLSVDPAGLRRRRDPATGLLTRTELAERAALEIVRAARYRRPLTLLLVMPGRSDGATMRACARVLQGQLRDLDIARRAYRRRHRQPPSPIGSLRRMGSSPISAACFRDFSGCLDHLRMRRYVRSDVHRRYVNATTASYAGNGRPRSRRSTHRSSPSRRTCAAWLPWSSCSMQATSEPSR
jgi:hypothetical protein